MHYLHKKARCDPEIATFRTKTIHFFQVYVYIGWQKLILGVPGPLVFNIVVRYWCKRKTLKETETEETRLFCHIFVIGKISIGVGKARLAKPMLQLRKIKKVFTNFPRGFWRFPTKFQRFKNGAVLEPRTGQFSRT